MTFALRRNGRTLLLSNRYRGSRTAISPSFVCQRSFFYLGDASELVDEFLVPSLRPASPPTPASRPAPDAEGVAPRVRAAMLDHVTLRTHDLEGTRVFFEKVLDLKPGYRPDFPFPGHWLYADGEPIVHLIPGGGGPVDRRGESIDHVGFRLKEYDG